MIRKALPKFTKIMSHKNLEPYGICTPDSGSITSHTKMQGCYNLVNKIN